MYFYIKGPYYFIVTGSAACFILYGHLYTTRKLGDKPEPAKGIFANNTA